MNQIKNKKDANDTEIPGIFKKIYDHKSAEFQKAENECSNVLKLEIQEATALQNLIEKCQAELKRRSATQNLGRLKNKK